MTSRPTVISIMSSIVYCGAKLGNLLTGVDLSNLGIFNRFQHIFGFRDQNSQQNQVNIPRLFSMNNNEPTPITRFQGLQNQYSDIHQFNSSLEEIFNSLNQLPINVLIDTVASSIVVSNNGVLSFRTPSLGIYRSVVCLASWMLTGISPITTNVAISLLEPSISNILNNSILKIASLIEPYRNMWLCQAATSIFDKIAQITLRIIPQSFVSLFNSNSQQNAEQPTLDENNQFSQDLPIQISSHQHAQYYINMFDQEINQLHQMVDLLLKIQIQSSLSLQSQRGPNPDFYRSSFAETLRNGTVQEKIKLIVDAFSKFLSLLLQIQTSANKFNLDFPYLENQVVRNQNSIRHLDSKINEQKRQADIIEQKINQINQRVDIINQFPPTQSPDLDQLTKLLQDFIQSQINQLTSQLDQTINQMKINYDNQFNDLNQEQLKHRQSLIDLHTQLQQLKDQITDQINQINVNHINQFISKTINQSMSLVEGQVNNVWASINELNFFISTKYSESDQLIKSCIDQYNQLKQDLQQNVYSKEDVDKITQELYQQILSQVYRSMPEYLSQQQQLNPQDISYIKQQLNNLPQPSQITDQAFNELKAQFENFRDQITAEFTNSSHQIQTLQQENVTLSQQLTLQLTNINQQQQTIEDLQHRINQQQDTNALLQQQIDKLNQNQEQQHQRQDTLDQRLNLITQRIDEYQTRQKSLVDRVDQPNQDILSVRTQQQQDLQNIQTLIQTLSQTISNKVDIAQLEQALQNLISKDQFDNQIRQQQDEIRQLQITDRQITEDINQINTLILQIQNYIDQISNQVINKDLFNDFQQQVEREIIDIQNHIQEIHDIPQQLNHIQLEVEQLENQLNNIVYDYDPLQIYNLKSQLQSLKEISYKKFDQLDYVANITQVNRILDFNHSAAIKSY